MGRPRLTRLHPPFKAASEQQAGRVLVAHPCEQIGHRNPHCACLAHRNIHRAACVPFRLRSRYVPITDEAAEGLPLIFLRVESKER